MSRALSILPFSASGFGVTLGAYFARRFATSAAAVFLGVFALIMIVDFVEMMRRAGDLPGVTPAFVGLLTLYRVPLVAEQVLPFAVLFGAMASFLMLSRKLELVVARAAGISAWQFVLPAVFVAFGLGVFMVTVYNPVSAGLKENANIIESRLFARAERAGRTREHWLRQKSSEGQAVINAESATEQGVALTTVSIFTFDDQGRFTGRIEAKSARLGDGAWMLTEARVMKLGEPPQTHATFSFPSNLTPVQVRESFATPQSVSFWQLPAYIELAERAGLAAQRYKLHYQSLLARPFLLVAMVLVAASVSLRFFRYGGVTRMVLTGVFAGFGLYVLAEMTEDLGAAEILSPMVAAWSPSVIGVSMGVIALLHLEDG